MLAAATGSLASLPFALAGDMAGVASFLVRAGVYASATALGALAFAAMMARIATSFPSGSFGRENKATPSYRGSRVRPAHTVAYVPCRDAATQAKSVLIKSLGS